MSRKQNISWLDVLDLRVIRKLALLVNRKWNVSLGFMSADGAMVEQEEGRRYVMRRPLCDLVQEYAEGKASCAKDDAAVSRKLNKRPDEESMIYICHAGLRSVVAPIVIEQEVQGAVLAGGYLSADPAALEPVHSALTQLGLAGSDLDDAIQKTPRLGPSEEGMLREIVELIAEEIVIFQAEAASVDRRQALALAERPTRYSYEEIIGQCRAMQELYAMLDKVIASDSTVLIQGENGTGKELIAQAIHFNSWRKDRRFVVQNCSAFNDNLLDSELFGHKKGSFTGAISDKQGLFEVADGSTFFLDEIGDMSPSLQVKLLRVLQEGTFIPVGDTQPKKVDVRIIAATNRDLKRMVERGEYREDLYYRINVINIHVPPLRERMDDIPELVDHFLKKQTKGNRLQLKKLSKACMSCLMVYSWPGNIRELENEIERLVVLAGEEKIIGEELLSTRIQQQIYPTKGAPGPNGLPEAVEDLERNMIYDVLKRNHWNKTRAAQELQISRRNLIRKVNKYQLDQRRSR
jgi:two-component system, NtrC family, response regulator HupR/HoxA